MKITDLFAKYDLDNTLLVGYYGGGNYGDELLLEVLLNLFTKRHVRQASITYRNLKTYPMFHRDVGYRLIDVQNKWAFVRAFITHKNIVVGGGGLWGLDTNVNHLLLGLLLLASRWLLGRRVFLVGVGFYNSANWLGRVSAFFAGKAATHIIARDQETFTNFVRINTHTSLDRDIAWYIKDLDLSMYKEQVQYIEDRAQVQGKTLLITLRRFKAKYKNDFADVVAKCLKQNQDKHIIVALLEPRSVDPAGFALLQAWQRQYKNVQILDFAFNPLALFLFFRKHQKNMAFIGPQFHAIISAHLNNVPFMPIVYDNKVSELLHSIGHEKQLSLYNVTALQLQEFIDRFAFAEVPIEAQR